MTNCQTATLYREAALMIAEGRAHYACTAIYALKRGMKSIHRPGVAFFQTFEPEALAFTQVFSNPKFPDDGQFTGVFGNGWDEEAREHRITALCLMADVLEAQRT